MSKNKNIQTTAISLLLCVCCFISILLIHQIVIGKDVLIIAAFGAAIVSAFTKLQQSILKTYCVASCALQ